jgi:peptidoglycan hydrolase CwlO-like protein
MAKDPKDPSDSESVGYHDQCHANAVAALAIFTNKAQNLVFEMTMEMRELQNQIKDLGAQNRQQSLKIESLSETIGEKDASIEALKAQIATLMKEKAKPQTA